MLHGFPIPCADELLYSLIARYAHRYNYPKPTAVFEELFGTTTLTATVDFPSRLRHLMAELVPGHPCGTIKILSDHTFLPWYAPFLPRERVEQVRDALLENGGSSILSRIGLIAGRVPVPPFLRFCPACLQEDINSSIESFSADQEVKKGALRNPFGIILEDPSAPCRRSFGSADKISASWPRIALRGMANTWFATSPKPLCPASEGLRLDCAEREFSSMRSTPGSGFTEILPGGLAVTTWLSH
jgi:hypothetical protein